LYSIVLPVLLSQCRLGCTFYCISCVTSGWYFRVSLLILACQ